MNKKILIYSDKIKSGKTTNLFKWISKQNSVSGILQPVVEDKRYIYSIVDKTLIQLEISEKQSQAFPENELIKIGKYHFLKNGFDKAKEILKRDFQKKYSWIVIDEIGPLELSGSGLEPAISEIFNKIESFDGKLILVIRDKLLNDVINKYNLDEKYELWCPSFD
ncbi:MAG: nucleoside-triphosphatase [Ignavibacteria bacterium]|jgi:nucleoside-triphosphatase THEP1